MAVYSVNFFGVAFYSFLGGICSECVWGVNVRLVPCNKDIEFLNITICISLITLLHEYKNINLHLSIRNNNRNFINQIKLKMFIIVKVKYIESWKTLDSLNM